MTKYVIPFVDPAWAVPFAIVDVLGGGVALLSATIEAEGSGIRSPASKEDLTPLSRAPPERFRDLVHYDPWWVFRGISGVDRARIDAILPTNLARPFVLGGAPCKVQDLTFAPGTRELRSVVAQDALFRRMEFRKGEIDLLSLRGPEARSRIRPSLRSAETGMKTL